MIAQLVEYNKKFLIIGNINAITYKEVFKLIGENRLWLGASIHSGDREFGVPKDYPLNAAGSRVDEKGNKFIRVKGVRWFTNLDYNERHEVLILYKKYTPETYPQYDNYDAINVDKTADIPCDYDGVMGVPITFLDKYNPDQFEIVAFRKGVDGKDLVYSIDNKAVGGGNSAILPHSHSTDYDIPQPTENGHMLTENGNTHEYLFATSIPGIIKNTEGKIDGRITYARLTIRRKRNILWK